MNVIDPEHALIVVGDVNRIRGEHDHAVGCDAYIGWAVQHFGRVGEQVEMGRFRFVLAHLRTHS